MSFKIEYLASSAVVHVKTRWGVPPLRREEPLTGFATPAFPTPSPRPPRAAYSTSASVSSLWRF